MEKTKFTKEEKDFICGTLYERKYQYQKYLEETERTEKNFNDFTFLKSFKDEYKEKINKCSELIEKINNIL